MQIHLITENDYAQVSNIYGQGIETGQATFETEPPTWEQWKNNHILEFCFGVFENSRLLGWVSLSHFSSRNAYKGVAEISIYIDNQFKAKGIGNALMHHVITQSEEAGFWTLFSSIFPENLASIHLHKKWGFREIGYREKIGQMNGVWRDTIILERRSEIVGI